MNWRFNLACAIVGYWPAASSAIVNPSFSTFHLKKAAGTRAPVNGESPRYVHASAGEGYSRNTPWRLAASLSPPQPVRDRIQRAPNRILGNQAPGLFREAIRSDVLLLLNQPFDGRERLFPRQAGTRSLPTYHPSTPTITSDSARPRP